MSRILKLAAVLLASAFACALFAGNSSAGSRPEPARQGGAPSTQGTGVAQDKAAPARGGDTSRPLTEQERRGKSLYLRGVSGSGREITAVVGEIDVPAATLSCAGCHGMRGEGKTEGGVTAGDLTWSNLIKPYGHTHPTGRKHGPFDEAAFIRSVVNGIDPAGNELQVAMPRYRMPAEDMADLIAYLKRIEFDRDPGLTDETIRVGTLLPPAGPLSTTGAAMRDVLEAYFAELNSRGGIYGRKIELRSAESGANAASAVESAKRLIDGEQVFALVGGVSAGADAELAALVAEREVPFIGPATLMPHTSAPVNRQVFYLLPGLAEMSRALVNFAAARPELKGARAAVVHADTNLGVMAAAAAEDQARKAGFGPVTRHSFRAATFDAAALVRQLKQEGVSVIFIFPANGEDAAIIKEAAGWRPHVLLPGVLAARDLAERVPPDFKDRVFLAFPTVPSDTTPAGLAEFRALHEKYKFEPRHTASQLAAFAAARVLVEALKLAGRDLSRERLLTALEGFYEYDSGVMPRLTFGPNRRIGAAGAHIVTIDPEKKEYRVASGWIQAH
jgi:ABC-type branched-subunit amino acid transport system substrate-binding protein